MNGERTLIPRSALAGSGLAVLATLIWAGNFIAARALRQDIPPVELSFWRWLIATTTLVPLMIRLPRDQWVLIVRHRRYLSLVGLLGVTIFNTLIYVASHSTTAVSLALLAVAAPIFMIAIARVVDGERITWRRGLGMAVALAGVIVLITSGSLAEMETLRLHPGDLIMLLATLIFAGYSMLVRRSPAALTNTALLVGVFGSGTILLAPVYLLDLGIQGGFTLTWQVAAALCYVGIAASAVAYSAWNRAIQLIGAPRTGLIYYLLPAFTAVGAWLVLGERTSRLQAISMLLIISGIAVGSRSPSVPTADPGNCQGEKT
jgi:drug/metabolite transporter (DMT)-like permease